MTIVAFLSTTFAFAQGPAESAPDAGKVRLRIGPLLMNPTIALTNIGVDQNVLNEPSDANPKKDFTVTVTPATDLWVRLGRSWVSGNIKEDLVWFQEHAAERTVNGSYSLGWRVPFNRLTLRTGVGYVNARDRPGFEIDARSQRREVSYMGSAELRAFPKTFIALNA